MAQEFGDGRRPAAAVGRVPAAAARPAGAGRRYRLAARSHAGYLGRLNLALLKPIYRPMTDPRFSVDRSWRMKFAESLVMRINDLLLRSEEHTSELQSLMRISYAVFCLKKKTK